MWPPRSIVPPLGLGRGHQQLGPQASFQPWNWPDIWSRFCNSRPWSKLSRPRSSFHSYKRFFLWVQNIIMTVDRNFCVLLERALEGRDILEVGWN